MEQCKWKDGKRTYCDPAENELPSIDDNFCRFCGGYIREIIIEPEEKYCNSECGMRMKYGISCEKHNCEHLKIGIEPEKLLIVRSGGTFAMEKNNINYLCITPASSLERELYLTLEPGYMRRWKPFSEIEKEGLTDTIALLRPIVIENNFACTLWGIETSACILADIGHSIYWKNVEVVRLATPYELQETE